MAEMAENFFSLLDYLHIAEGRMVGFRPFLSVLGVYEITNSHVNFLRR